MVGGYEALPGLGCGRPGAVCLRCQPGGPGVADAVVAPFADLVADLVADLIADLIPGAEPVAVPVRQPVADSAAAAKGSGGRARLRGGHGGHRLAQLVVSSSDRSARAREPGPDRGLDGGDDELRKRGADRPR